MKTRYILPIVLVLLFPAASMAQDSAKVVNTLREFLALCRTADLSDPKAAELGLFYKAAPYIIYRGDDDERRWKSAANYRDPKDKEQVDEICTKINHNVNLDTNYTVKRYTTDQESEGEWHLVEVHYMKNGSKRKAVFGFLKVNDKFLLGDID